MNLTSSFFSVGVFSSKIPMPVLKARRRKFQNFYCLFEKKNSDIESVILIHVYATLLVDFQLLA